MFLSSFFGYALGGFLYVGALPHPVSFLRQKPGDFFERLKISESRRGDENRPKPRILASTPMNGESHPGSLSEGAGSPQGLTEGVSSDG